MKKILVVGLILFLGLTIAPSTNAVVFTINDEGNADESSNGLVIHGYDDASTTWYGFFANAQDELTKWCDNIQSGLLDAETISDRISNYDSYGVSYFYVIAHSHGESTRFQTTEGNYYTADQLREDMMNRPPIKFAFICCCEGMTNYNEPGSLSYEFRKGQLDDTVTIGYTNIQKYKDEGGSMKKVLKWQEALFIYINRGYTIKKAFDKACEIYPELANYVKFEGDPDVKVTTAVSVDSDVKIPTDPGRIVRVIG